MGIFNIFADTKTASAIRTVLQMGGAALTVYGIMSPDEVTQVLNGYETVLGAVAALAGIAALIKAKFGK